MAVSLQDLFPFGRSTATAEQDTPAAKTYPYYPIAYTRNTSAAALACAEALQRPGLNQEIIDNLLTSSLAEHLADQRLDVNELELRRLARDLLQPAKDSLLEYYRESRKENPYFDDIVHSANEESDFDFLKLVIGLYAREFVRQTAI